MKVLSWNILHCCDKHATDILDAIEKEQDGIINLQEFRHDSSQQVLLDGLNEMELDEQFVPETIQ